MFPYVWHFTGVGLLFIAISIPLVFRKIPPNRFYGYRVKATVENPFLWYEVNSFAGRYLIGSGAIVIMAAWLLHAVRVDPIKAVSFLTILAVSLTTISLLLSHRALKKLLPKA